MDNQAGEYSPLSLDLEKPRLSDGENYTLLEEGFDRYAPRGNKGLIDKPRRFWMDIKLSTWLNIFIFILNVLGVAFWTLSVPRYARTVGKLNPPQIGAPSPAQEIVELHLQRFVDPDHESTPWSGLPSDETDQAWDQLVNNGRSFAIDAELFAEINGHPETGVRIPNDPEGRFVGILEVTHQLHCVDIMRRGAWFNFEYYHDKQFFENKTDAAIIWHMRHCFEVLRQAIQCHGDTTMLTYNWIKDYPVPQSAWKSLHSCQNWDRVVEWREQHDITSKLKVLERPLWVLDPEGVVPGKQGAAEVTTHGGI